MNLPKDLRIHRPWVRGTFHLVRTAVSYDGLMRIPSWIILAACSRSLSSGVSKTKLSNPILPHFSSTMRRSCLISRDYSSIGWRNIL